MDLLIKTKMRAPPLRPDLLARPHLVARFCAGLAGPLTLIAAPAGFGKTTLTASAIAVFLRSATTAGATHESQAAWLSLDAGDNEIGRFLVYLVASVQAAAPDAARTAAGLLAGPQIAPAEVVLGTLINDLTDENTRIGAHLILVLDDYHLVSSPVVHAAVTFLIEHASPALHLVIATRVDPPLPLARLRARGQLLELRASDLRFSTDETSAFFKESAGLHLADDLVASLGERTEGWIAGLQLAALRLASVGAAQPVDAAAFVHGFSGTQRYILDYLVQEVLERQSPAVQRFLLLTAPLARLCGPLCDAVLQAVPREGEEGTCSSLGSGAATLAALERDNLFLVPLDDERQWYRYHHLFADLLRARLRERYPGSEPRLHAAAAAWLEGNGCIVEAVDEALAAGEHILAARLVEENTAGMLARGELAALLGWIGVLPAELRRARPRLGVQQAYALAFAGRLLESSAVLDLVEQATAGAQSGSAQAGAVAAVRAMLAVMGGQDAAAVRCAEASRALLSADATWDRAAACWALGYAKRSLGLLDEARQLFAEQIELARAMDNVWTLVTGLTDLAQVLRAQGELQRAHTLLQEALSAAAQQGARSSGYIARMEAGLGGILYECNELDAASDLLASAVMHTQQWPNPNHVVFACLLLARTRRAQGDAAAADLLLQQAYGTCRGAPITRLLQRQVEAEIVRCYARAANNAPAADAALAAEAAMLAEQWRHELASVEQIADSLALDPAAELALLALAAVASDAHEAGQLLPLLLRAADSAAQASRVSVQIEALVWAALLQSPPVSLPLVPMHRDSRCRWQQSFVCLEQALQLAQGRGYARVFLDAGGALPPLLAAWLAGAGNHPARAYAMHLLAACDVQEGLPPAHPTGVRAPGQALALAEPLSAREREVLALLAQGLSNQAIAAHLVVAPGTVKAHTAAIYRKLDVPNRTAAVSRARQWGIIS